LPGQGSIIRTCVFRIQFIVSNHYINGCKLIFREQLLYVRGMRVSEEVQMRFFVTLLFPQRVCAFLESRDQDV
jgi:hypothetical protein